MIYAGYHHIIKNEASDGSVNVKAIQREEICLVSYDSDEKVTVTFRNGTKLPLELSLQDVKHMRGYFVVKGFIDIPSAQINRDAIHHWECDYKEDNDARTRLFILAQSGDEFTFTGKQARDIYKAIVCEL